MSLYLVFGAAACQADARLSHPPRRRVSLRDWADALWRDHSNRMWCRAGALVALCAGERFAAALGVAGLTHTCVERPERGGRLCPSDSAVHSAERQRNLRWYAASFQCHLCVCECVSVSVGFVTPQSLTHADYLRLRQKSRYKPHLVSKQSATQTQHI